MNAKLTLKLNIEVIERAKSYARKKNMSLSKLIESHLDFLTVVKVENTDITPLVKSLSGKIELPADYNYKEEYKNHLSEKYG